VFKNNKEYEEYRKRVDKVEGTESTDTITDEINEMIEDFMYMDVESIKKKKKWLKIK
jgi:hypothetical protein